MQELLNQLGIDWHLLLSQAVNFFLLLFALRFLVYEPLFAVLEARRRKIEEGVAKAEEANQRLRESEEVKRAKIKEGEMQALELMKKTEREAKALEAKLVAEAKRREAEELASTAALLRGKEEESRRAMEKEAAALVRSAILKTVQLAPEKIDEALIKEAVAEAAKSVSRKNA